VFLSKSIASFYNYQPIRMPFILITTSKMTSDEDMDEDPPRGMRGGNKKP
jgi:hypothetical protein